jgi:hypothetical protein
VALRQSGRTKESLRCCGQYAPDVEVFDVIQEAQRGLEPSDAIGSHPIVLRDPVIHFLELPYINDFASLDEELNACMGGKLVDWVLELGLCGGDDLLIGEVEPHGIGFEPIPGHWIGLITAIQAFGGPGIQ